jgi:hypothetical protein
VKKNQKGGQSLFLVQLEAEGAHMAEEARERDTKFTDQVCDWRNKVTDRVLRLFPRRTAEHLVNFQKEGLLAVRSLLDRGIDMLDSDLNRVHERPPRQ